MAQTKRKRQTKHRGNAAGVVESRGRTSRPPSAAERKEAERKASRSERLSRKPTWRGAATKSALGAAFMFVFLMILAHPKHGSRLTAALFPALLVLCLYLPGSYYLETYMWKRRTGQARGGSGFGGMFGGFGRRK